MVIPAFRRPSSPSWEALPQPSFQPAVALSVVLPAFNEAQGLETMIEEYLLPILKDLFCEDIDIEEASTWSQVWEVILVDDGSRDPTYEVISVLAERYSWIRGIRLSRNFGKEAAILAGLEATRGKATLVMDSDGQHPPEVLQQMWSIWKTDQFDVISGVKKARDVDRAFSRVMAASFYRVMRWMTNIDLQGQSDFKLMRHNVVRAYLEQPENLRFFRALVPWLGFRQAEVPFVVAERLAGNSQWSLWGLFRLALTAITSFTGAPLYWAAYIGVFGIGISIILGIQAIFSKLTGIAIDGWTSLTVIQLFFSSMILFSLGLIGIYLHQIFLEVKARRPFIIQERTSKKSENKV
ncbi:MAG: glycosyltransferase family 2 protein [Myxococcota bacterium]